METQADQEPEGGGGPAAQAARIPAAAPPSSLLREGSAQSGWPPSASPGEASLRDLIYSPKFSLVCCGWWLPSPSLPSAEQSRAGEGRFRPP